MRHHRIFPHLMSALLLTMFSGSVFADLATQTIVDNFNSMNSNKGYLFNSLTNTSNTSGYFGQFSGENRLTNNGTDTPSLSGYAIGTTANNGTGSNFYFQTFCVEPTRTLYNNETSSGKLNYTGSGTQTAAPLSTPLNLGVAYLYKEFAAGTLANYSYTYGSGRINTAVLLQDAIWFLLGKTDELVVSTTGWGNNIFLQQLSAMSGYDWLQSYDPTLNYGGLMGDAKVFVVQTAFDTMMRSPTLVRQDVLYVTRGGSDVPEPASILLWTLGSLGAAGLAYRKRKAASK